jgi:dienelactone hydrolase
MRLDSTKSRFVPIYLSVPGLIRGHGRRARPGRQLSDPGRLHGPVVGVGVQPVGWWSRIVRRTLVFVALALGLCSGPAFSQPLILLPPVRVPLIIPPVPSPHLNERVIHIPMTISGPSGTKRLTLEATLYKPSGPGPFPLVVLSHGTPRNPDWRVAQGRLTYSLQSWKFVSMGFAVVIPMRRGYGHSQGSYAEDVGPLDHANFYKAGVESARDLRATIEYVSTLPFIDGQRLVLAGYSSGGFASLILASRGLPGVKGIINFSGGRGSTERGICSPGRLIAACGLAGRTTRVPTLWIYSENDTYFPPWLARDMQAAFQRAGGRADLVMLPPFYEEGHYLFTDLRGLNWWTPAVNRFLNNLGFPGLMCSPP